MVLNLRDQRLMQAPSWDTFLCPVCGRVNQSRHHVVYRSHGGGSGPTISLCGFDNVTGCHGKAHQGYLHFNYVNGWMFLLADKPCSSFEADEMDGWKPLRNFDSLMGAC